MSEADIQAEILVAVSRLPHALFWRANSGVARTVAGNVIRANVPGTADIVGCYRGRFIGLEVKTSAGRQSHTQRLFQAAVERAGGTYVIARSVSDAISALAAIP